MKKTELFILCFLIFVLFVKPFYVQGHGGENPATDYEGPTLLVPLIEQNPTLDGNIETNEYPEPGHLVLPGFEDEIKLTHNKTHLFLAMSYETLGFGGFGIRAIGGHNTIINDNLAYFFAWINNTETQMQVVIASDEFEPPLDDPVTPIVMNAVGKQADNTTTLEFSVNLSNKHQSNTEPNDTIDNEVAFPDSGSIFNLKFLRGDTIEIDPESVFQSSLIPAYLLREGENPEQIAEILRNEPNLIDAIVFPIITLILSLFIIWRYFPRKTKLDNDTNN